jgi:hypothetical protein
MPALSMPDWDSHPSTSSSPTSISHWVASLIQAHQSTPLPYSAADEQAAKSVPLSPHLVPARVYPKHAATATKNMPPGWQSDVLSGYASRGQPARLFEYLMGMYPHAPPSERLPVSEACEALASALSAAGRPQAALDFLLSVPYKHRTATLYDRVLGSLAAAGRVRDVEALLGEVKPCPPVLRKRRIQAHAAAGDFETALAIVRSLAYERAQVVRGTVVVSPSGAAAPPGARRLTSHPFDALIEAAGAAGAPHFSRALFEALVRGDAGHGAALASLGGGGGGGGLLLSGLTVRDSAASAVAAAAAAAAAEAAPSSVRVSGSGGGGGGGAPTGGAAAESLFASVAEIRAVGDAAPTMDTYVALVRAYGTAGDAHGALAAWGLLRARVAAERERAAADYLSGGSDSKWRLTAGGYEALLDAHVRFAAARVAAGGGAGEGADGGGGGGALPPRPALPGSAPNPTDVAHAWGLRIDRVLDEMDSAVVAGGHTAVAVAAVVAYYVLHGEGKLARSLYGHMAQNEAHAHVFAHPLALTAMVEGYAALARAAVERRDDAGARAIGVEVSQLFFTACPPDGAPAPPEPPMEATGALCAAALAVFAEAGMVGECRLVLARMAAAELEPSGCEFAALQRLAARGAAADALAFASLVAQLDPPGGRRVLRHSRGGPAFLTTLALLAPECPRFAVDQLLDCARADDPPPPDALLEALLAVAAALPAAAAAAEQRGGGGGGGGAARGGGGGGAFKDPAAAFALLREALRHVLHGAAFRGACYAYESVAAPAPARAAEGRVARLVHEAVDACALAAVVARGVALEAGLDPSMAAALGAALSGGAAPEPAYETRVLRRAAHCVELALAAFGALIARAPGVEDAEAMLAEAADFQRANAPLLRLARALAGTAAEADAPQVGASPALRRLRVAAAVEPFQAPLAGLLHFAARAPPGREVRVAAVVGGLAQAGPLEAARPRLAGAAVTRAVPCGAGAATALAWAALLEAEAVAPAPSAALAALRLALAGGEASAAAEAELVPALRRAFDAGVGAGSPFGPLLPAAALGSGGGKSALSAALLLSDEALPLRLAGAAGLRAGCLVVSLWQAYLADKGVLALGAAAAPFGAEPARAAQAAYLAALAAVAACGGAADSTDVCRAPVEDVATAVVPRVPLCPFLALEQARATVCAMAEAGSGPGLADAAALARLCVSVGLIPDARLLLRLVMAPLLGRDYSAAALEEDAARDGRRLRLQLGNGSGAPQGALPPWSAWPGQEEVLALSVSSEGRAGLAFGATPQQPHSTFSALVEASARSRAQHPLPLDNAAFCELALSIGAAGLADELLSPLVEAAAELQAGFSAPALPLLDGAATAAVYGAFAMCGDMERAEAVLRDPRFCPPVLVKPSDYEHVYSAAALDAAAARTFERPTALRPPTPAALSVFEVHRPLAGTSPLAYAALVNTFRAIGLASTGNVHRALRLLEVAVVHPSPSGRPLVHAAAFSAVLAACLRLSDAELTAEPPADSARATLANPYADARKLLGEQPSAAEVGSGVFVGGEPGSFASLMPLVQNPGPQLAPLLSQLEVIGAALRGAAVWSASLADLPLLVRLYGAAKRTDEAAALGWAGVAVALEALRLALLRDVERGGLGAHPSPTRGRYGSEAATAAAERLRTVELLLLDALQLCHAPLPALRGGIAPLRAGSFGTAEERPAPPPADTVERCRALGEAWGLPFPTSGGGAGAGAAAAHPAPGEPPAGGGGSTVPPTATLLGSLVDALALLYATAPPSAYSARRVVEHSARTLLDAAAAAGAPLSGASGKLLALVLSRCKASGSYAPHNSAAAEAVAAVCDFPPPPHAQLLPAATPALLMRVAVAAAPAAVVWGRAPRGGARRAFEASAAAPPPPPPPPAQLAPNVLLSVLAFTGALRPAAGPPRGAPCAQAAQLHSALAWRAGAPRRVTTHSATAVGALLADTARAFGGEPPPRAAPPPPRPLDVAAAQAALAAAVAGHHLAAPGAGAPPSPAAARAAAPADPAARALENEVLALEEELEGLRANTGAGEEALLRLRQQAEAEALSPAESGGGGGGGGGGVRRAAGPLAPLPAEAAPREAALRALLATLGGLEETLTDALALQPEQRADLAAWMEVAARVEAGAGEARRALQDAAAATSALEAAYHEMVAVFEASVEASRSPRYGAAGRAAAAERAAELQPRVLGPAVASIVAAQTARLRAEAGEAARARARGAEALLHAQRWAFEVAALEAAEGAARERGFVEAAERRLEAARGLAGEAAGAEAGARLQLRALRARVDAAAASLAPPQREAAARVAALRGEEAALRARKEGEARALAGERAQLAAAGARAEGESALAAVRAAAASRMEAAQAEYRERGEAARRAIRGELDGKLAPVMEAARAGAARAEERLRQLRREVGVLEGDLHATLGASAALLGVGGEPAGGTLLGAELCAAVEQVAEMGSSREAAALTLAVLDDLLPVALAAQNSTRGAMLLQALEEAVGALS